MRGTLRESITAALFDVLPIPALILDREALVVAANLAALDFVAKGELRRPGGEMLGCIHAEDVPAGCGHGPECGDCPLRATFMASVEEQTTLTRRAQLTRHRIGRVENLELIITATPIENGGEMMTVVMLQDLTELVLLREMIPICSGCHQIRNDEELWQRVDRYFGEKMGIAFTHGLCPACVTKFVED